MKKEKNKYPFFELSSPDFENLCFDIIRHINPNHELIKTSKIYDSGFDFEGFFKNNEGKNIRIIYECKRISEAPFSLFDNQINKLISKFPKINKMVFIISSTISPNVLSRIQKLSEENKIEIEIIDFPKLTKYLDELKEISEKYFSKYFKQEKSQRKALKQWTASLLIPILAGILANGVLYFKESKKEPLEAKIIKVSNAIENLKSLESDLKDIRSDIEKTQKAKVKIEEEFEKAKVLEKLSVEQLDAVKSALKTESLISTIINWIIAFVLGVISSIIATILINIYKRKKEIQKNENDV